MKVFTAAEDQALTDRAAACLAAVLGDSEEFWRERIEHWRRRHQEIRDALPPDFHGLPREPAAHEHGAANARS